MTAVRAARRRGFLRGIIGAVLLATALSLIACGGSDDSAVESGAEQEPPGAQAQADEQAEVESTEPQSGEDTQAEDAESAAAEQSQADTEEDIVEEHAEQAQGEPEAQAQEDELAQEEEPQPEEQAHAEPEQPEPLDPAAALALLADLHLGSLQAQADFRFSGTLDLAVDIDAGANRSLDLLTALGRITFEGSATPASGDIDLTISFGSNGAGGLPPFGIRQVGGALYTNFGFGWDEQPPDADVLELASVLIDVRDLGFDFRALFDAIQGQGRLSGLLAGDRALWQSFAAFILDRDILVPLEGSATGVQSYEVAGFDLSSIGRALIDPQELEAQLGLEGGIYGGYDGRDDTRATLDVDRDSGLLLRIVADIDGPSVDFDINNDPGTVFFYSDFGAESAHLELDVDPTTGAPVRFLAEMPYFYVDSETPYEGSLRLEFVVDSINAGDVVIEPPI